MKYNFPYKYYFYGSDDSQDLDVLIQITSDLMPVNQEDRKVFIKNIETEYDLNWNANLIIVEDGYISDTIYPKSWIDSLNNSLFNTYNLHKQVYPLPIKGLVKRNKLLAIYKTIRTVLSMLSRTQYRTTVKPILKGVHPFQKKIDALYKIDFTTIDSFSQDNTKDVDIWKIIGFYIGQNISLIRDNIEIYTKKDLIINHPDLTSFVYRQEITDCNKVYLNNLIKYYLENIVIPFGDYKCQERILICGNEKIDMKNEIYI